MKRNFLSISLIALALVFVVGCAAETPTTQKMERIDEKVLPESLQSLDLTPDLNRGRLVINEETLAKMADDGVPESVLAALRNMEGKKTFNTVEEFTQAVKAASPESEKFMDRILGNALVTELEDEPEPPQSDMAVAQPSEVIKKPPPAVVLVPGRPPPPPPRPPVPPMPVARPWSDQVVARTPSLVPFETVLFDFDKSEILAEFKTAIQENATKLLDDPEMVATIEGHADERGTNEYNLALGQRRAEAIRDALIEAGVSPSQLQTITFGEERPVDSGKNESAWRLNRRGEMVVHP